MHDNCLHTLRRHSRCLSIASSKYTTWDAADEPTNRNSSFTMKAMLMEVLVMFIFASLCYFNFPSANDIVVLLNNSLISPSSIPLPWVENITDVAVSAEPAPPSNSGGKKKGLTMPVLIGSFDFFLSFLVTLFLLTFF